MKNLESLGMASRKVNSMFKQPQVEQFQVLPRESVVYKDGRFYRVESYGLVELPQPQELPKPEPTPEEE
jgi:hypothetical protein